MREQGARLIEIEHIRGELRKNRASPETFRDLDKRHRAELALNKRSFRRFIWSVVLTILLIGVGITTGAFAVIYFRAEGINSVVGYWNSLCSVFLLYTGKKQIIG
jgi:hypothetical protein